MRSREIVDDIALRISEFDLSPGQRLTEEGLAQRYGVSRTPIREALKALYQMDLVERLDSGGYAVCRVDLDSVSNLITIWATLEDLALDLASKNGQQEDFEKLQKRTRSSNHDPASVEEFHHDLARLSGNEELAALLNTIYARTRPYRRLDALARSTEVTNDHEEIARLMVAGEFDVARRLIREHVERTHEFIDKLISGGVRTILFEPSSD